MDGSCTSGSSLFHREYDRIWVGVVLNYGDSLCATDPAAVLFCTCRVAVEDTNHVSSLLPIFHISLLLRLRNCRFSFNIPFCVVDCDRAHMASDFNPIRSLEPIAAQVEDTR